MSITAYKPLNSTVYTGLSTDTKPSAAKVGDKFIETDTGKVYVALGPSTWSWVASISNTGTGSFAAVL